MAKSIKWGYDARINRYRDLSSGKLLSRNTVTGYRDKIVDAASKRTSELAHQVASGTITPSDFAAEMRKIVKIVHVAQFELGKGGRNAITATDRGIIGRALRDQYAFLDSFQRDIEAAVKAGTVNGEQIANRAALYVEDGVAMHERAAAEARGVELPPESPPVHNRCRCSWRWSIEDGKHVAYWVLGDAPCPQCSALASQYQPWTGSAAA